MITLTTKSNGEVKTYNSLADACRQNGATSGMNRDACIRFLDKAGFNMSSLVEEEGKGSATTRKPAESIVEKLVKLCKVVDTARVKELEAKKEETLRTLKKGSDADALVAIVEELDKAQNPTVTRNALHARLDALITEYNAEHAGNEILPEPVDAPVAEPTEPKSSKKKQDKEAQ
jgi:hypothetical protein